MNRSRKTARKLSLHTETLCPLADRELASIHGGAGAVQSCFQCPSQIGLCASGMLPRMCPEPSGPLQPSGVCPQLPFQK